MRIAEAPAFVVTVVAGLVVILAVTTGRPRLEGVRALADRWFLLLLVSGVLLSLAGEVLFDPAGGLSDAIVRGAAFGVTAWVVQALLAARTGRPTDERLRTPALVLCLVPLALAIALG